MKKNNLHAMTIIFLIFIFGLTIASFLQPVKTFSESENRVLASKPEFTWENLKNGSYSSGYETFITDQFLLRDTWIGMKTMTERMIGKKDINGVYFAKDGYLIEKVDTTDIDQEQVDKNITRVESFIRKYSGLLGKDRVYAMVVPTAFDILEEKLPAFAVGYSQDILLDELQKRLGENWIDLRQVLKSHSEEYIFYRTDHHWTTLGAFYAYQEAAKAFGLTAFDKEDFTIKKVNDSFLGTLYSKVNVPMNADSMHIFDSEREFAVEYNMSGDIKHTLYETEYLDTKDKYAMYLGGNNALVEINTNVDNGRKLLVIKDSYAHCFTPFMAEHFETVYMIDFRYFSMPVSSFIENNGITDALILYNANSFVSDKNIYQLGR